MTQQERQEQFRKNFSYIFEGKNTEEEKEEKPVKQPSTSTCPHCGKVFPRLDRYCPRCGYPN